MYRSARRGFCGGVPAISRSARRGFGVASVRSVSAPTVQSMCCTDRHVADPAGDAIQGSPRSAASSKTRFARRRNCSPFSVSPALTVATAMARATTRATSKSQAGKTPRSVSLDAMASQAAARHVAQSPRRAETSTSAADARASVQRQPVSSSIASSNLV